MKNLIIIICTVLLCISCQGDLNLNVPLVKDTPTGSGSGNPGVPDNEIIFTPAQLKMPTKKGVCLSLKKDTDPAYEQNMAKVKALNAGWNYSWANNLVGNQPIDMEFVPMFFTVGKTFVEDISRVRGYMFSGQCKRVIAFNEPDAKEQGNVPVEAALSNWPYLQALRVPLGSPAPTHPTNEWMTTFMNTAKERNYRVDYICIHSYPGPNTAGLKKLIEDTYNLYQKPILITEFAVADWSATSVAGNKYTPAQALAFMKDILPFLESKDYVLGYCWFSFSPDSAAGAPSALFDRDGNLTELGRYYAAFKSSN